MSKLRLCGYRLAATGLRLRWTDKPYAGYDRELYFDPHFRFEDDDGTELWRLQRASLEKHVYFTRLEDMQRPHRGFAKCGKHLENIRIQVDVESVESAKDLENLPPAEADSTETFEVLGFDAGWLLGNHSLLFQRGFMERMEDMVQSAWARKLNEHGLFSRLDDAGAFRDFFYEQRGRQPEGVMEYGDFAVLQIARLRGTGAVSPG